MLDALKENYGSEIQVVYRHLPLITIHDKAQVSAEASEAAGAQGMFWEMHDILFERQTEWSSIPEATVIETFVEYAEMIGISDIDQFREDLENDTYAEKVLGEYQIATQANLSSTPTFFMNYVGYPSREFGLSYEGLDAFIQLMKLRNRWFSDGPEQVIDPAKTYEATVETEKGDIVFELFSDTAPVNVNSFVFLAQQGWYEDVSFHRVLEGFMAQGGDPTGLGIGFPGYRCDDEVNPARSFDGPGVVALANSGPNSNGSQFFITFGPTEHLNPSFTIIGQVTDGQDIVDSLTLRDPQNPNAGPGDRIINIVVEEK